MKRVVGISHIARVLGWERPRVLDALEAIPAAREGTGLRMVRGDGDVAIHPVHAGDRDLRRALGASQVSGKSLNITSARILARVINGERIADRGVSYATKTAIGALKNMRCIELDESARYRITDELKMALPDLE